MTCIVAVKGVDSIVMGGDSAGVSGYDIALRKDPKVFEIGQFVIGFTSSFRIGQVLMDLKVPKQKGNQTDHQYMRTTFVKAVRTALEESGCLKSDHEVKSGGCFLVIYKKEIYRIEEDFQVEVRHDTFNACGCGESYAIGALAATDKHVLSEHPDVAVEIALSVAARYSGGVAAPWTIISKKV